MNLSELVASMSKGNDRLGYTSTVKDQIDNIEVFYLVSARQILTTSKGL